MRVASRLALLAVLALAGSATADSSAPKRKANPTTDKFAKAAAEAFGDALIADEKGDLPTALGLYQKAQAIAPHPSTTYNIGDVQRRLGNFEQAIVAFETYLALLPTAPDRKECEAIIETLLQTPGTIFLTTLPASAPDAIAFKDYYILVDGVIQVKPGTSATLQKEVNQVAIALPVLAGTHAIDVVSAISYGYTTCEVRAGKHAICKVQAKPRIDGRLVIRGDEHDLSVRMTINEHWVPLSHDRIDLPPGKRRLQIRDRQWECPWLDTDIPAGSADIAYVFLDSKEYRGLERCRKLDIRQLKLHFD
ncbi:MAG: tetratricopeptide repeat protein [Proteobacteria bacterium]|nr:tetratricopeptide repeat protein [Pseudomonadota bacterium]